MIPVVAHFHYVLLGNVMAIVYLMVAYGLSHFWLTQKGHEALAGSSFSFGSRGFGLTSPIV